MASASCAFAASFYPNLFTAAAADERTIDVIFSSGFEADPALQLTSEQPYSGSLPVLESGHQTVGSSALSFNVDPSGQAAAEYPIFVGTGTAGVAPSVSLRYSSAAGDGHLGVGWSISGITVISRCRETFESKDGTEVSPSPIGFDSADKFCLNGERLFAISGTYGGNNTEYRTEKEQFARIKSYDSSDGDNNPDYFTVERKDGSISYYGNSSDSNQTVSAADSNINGKTLSWTINRYQDNSGNYIDYRYNQYADGEFTLSDIDFTGNASTTPALLPYNNLHFIYEDRNQPIQTYMSGVAFTISKRLASIQSGIEGTVVREYTLDYTSSTTSSRPLLGSIQECRGSHCMPLTMFNWSQPNHQFKTTATGNTPFPSQIKSSKLGDVNGDGRADLIIVDQADNGFKVALANGYHGFSVATATGIYGPLGSQINNKWHLLDYNADGRVDLMRQYLGQWVIHLSNSNGFNQTPIQTGISVTQGVDFQVIDVNGDGLSDLFYPDGQAKVRYLQRTATGYQFSTIPTEIDLPISPTEINGIAMPNHFLRMQYIMKHNGDIDIKAHDVNGDGVADLILRANVYRLEVVIDPNDPPRQAETYYFTSIDEELETPEDFEEVLDSSHWVAFVNRGLNSDGKLDYRSENHYVSSAIADKDMKLLDINADGLIDFAKKQSDSAWLYRLNSGKGFLDWENINDLNNAKHIQFIDYNLDGNLDLIYPTNLIGNTYYCKLWTGQGFASTAIPTTAKAQDPDQNLNLFIDFDGDGASDQLQVNQTGQQRLYARQNSYQATDKITAFTNGLGAKTQVKYRPITFSDTYAQGNHQTTAINWGNGSPVFDLMGAIYVVRQVTTDAPVAGQPDQTTDIRYQYKEGKIQGGGRGFLGFKQIITETPIKSTTDDTAKILQTVTTYRQDFPYNGLPASTTVTQIDSDYYSSNNIPPSCELDDDCFPDPCLPGEICQQLPRTTGAQTLVSQTDNTPAYSNPTVKSHFPYIANSETKTYDPDSGALLKTVIQNSTHDAYGNPLSTTLTVKDAQGTVQQTNSISNQYQNITTAGRWQIGLLTRSIVSKQKTGSPMVTTETAYSYNSNGLLSEERRHNDQINVSNSDLFLRIQYQYDPFGNNNKIRSCSNHLSQSACRSEAFLPPDPSNPYQINRYNRLTFDAKGRYIQAGYNTLEQRISMVNSRNLYGSPISSTDLSGTVTTNSYDAFGRLTSSRNSIGQWSQTSKSWCNSLSGPLSCPSAAIIRIRKLASGGSASYGYIDKLGREIATINRSFNDYDNSSTVADERYIIKQTHFDRQGRQSQIQGPNFLNATAQQIPVNTVKYDRYNRPTDITQADGSKQTITYSGLNTTYTNALGQRKQETQNALGQLIEVKDFDQAGTAPNYQNTLSYNYNSLGLVTTIKRTTAAGTEMLSHSQYDQAGRKYRFDDVDSGLSHALFNAESELIQSQDAKGQILLNHYDNLGRVYQTQSYAGTTLQTTTKNSYNPSNGLLLKQQKFLTNQTLPDYTEIHSYDAYNRPATTQVHFKDSVCGGLNCYYNTAVYYDRYSRIKYQQDASGKAIHNHYNNQGYLQQVSDAADSNKQYYQIRKTDKWGNITQDRRGGNDDLIANYNYHNTRGWLFSVSSIHQYNVYEFDSLGNLLKRADINNNQSECFNYDRLNRLTDSYRYNDYGQNCASTAGHIEHQLTAYDGRGNITQKDGKTYHYQTALPNSIGTSPHQVQSKGLQQFSYDANGNNITTTHFTDSSGNSTTRHIEYNSYDKITRVYTGSSHNPTAQSRYRYDSSESQFSRIDIDKQGQQTTTHFIGNVEIEYSPNGQIAYKRQLGNYAIITETNHSTQEAYRFNDHLGSVDIITDQAGNQLQAMSFNAWGERRLPANWQALSVTTQRNFISSYTGDGFTGHEMLDAFGIINMGGRIYDPSLGRVLQADPFVQEPTNSQSFNRYSYVFNNPISYTDPSGYLTGRQILGIVVGIALSFFLGPLATTLWKAMLIGFASGFVSGAIITGSLKGALKSGLIGAAVAGVMFQITGGPADAADPKAATAGGAGDATTTTTLESANAATETTTATTQAIETVSQQAGNTTAQTVGQEINGSAAAGQAASADPGITLPPLKAVSYDLDVDGLLTALMINALSVPQAMDWAQDIKTDKDLTTNRLQIAKKIEKIASNYWSVSEGYNKLLQQGIYGMGAAATVAPAGGYARLAAPAIKRGAVAMGKKVAIAWQRAANTTKDIAKGFNDLSTIGKIEIFMSTADLTSMAAGGVARKSALESFVAMNQQRVIQQAAQKALKMAELNQIIISKTPTLLKK